MKKGEILLGYELKTAEEVNIFLSHLVVTGLTQLSGKTTTLEALIKRSKLRAIAFKTKRGEEGFSQGTIIRPYFKERSDWQFISALLEATMRERMKFERSWIIRACRGTRNMREVYENCRRLQGESREGSLQYSIYTNLIAYFEIVLPQIEKFSFSHELNLKEGINIMDLEEMPNEVQSLVIQSTLEYVLKNEKGIVVIIPEMWKFCPENRGNPVKWVAEEFIRQGATRKNFLWLDSMPSYEVIFVKHNNQIKIMTFEELFNLKGKIKKTINEEIKILEEDVKILDNDKIRLKWYPITKVFRHRYKGRILSIQTLDGMIDVSPNHPVLKYPRYMAEAKELKIGERIQSRQIEKKWRIHNHRNLFVGTEDLAWLLGFFCAEGWINGNHTCICNKRKELLEKAKQIIKNNFHHSASLNKPIRKVFTLDCNSPSLAKYFKIFCYNSTKYNSISKKVPTEILNSPIEIKNAFLDGYLEGDGHFDKDRNYLRSFSSNSRALIFGILELFNALLGRITYSLHTRKDKQNISVCLNKNKNKFIRDKVKTIKKKFYSGYLYDIETNSPKHTFYMGIGNIRVHNSQDLAGVDKSILKQVANWILGLQTEINEVQHTLDQIPLPKNQKPKEDEIMTLKIGHFIVCNPYFTKKVYVCPSWLDIETAKKIALGIIPVETVLGKKKIKIKDISRAEEIALERSRQKEIDMSKKISSLEKDNDKLRQEAQDLENKINRLKVKEEDKISLEKKQYEKLKGKINYQKKYNAIVRKIKDFAKKIEEVEVIEIAEPIREEAEPIPQTVMTPPSLTYGYSTNKQAILENLPPYEKDIMDAIVKHPNIPFSRSQLAVMSRKSSKSSQYNTAIAKLKKLNLLEERDHNLYFTGK